MKVIVSKKKDGYTIHKDSVWKRGDSVRGSGDKTLDLKVITGGNYIIGDFEKFIDMVCRDFSHIFDKVSVETTIYFEVKDDGLYITKIEV